MFLCFCLAVPLIGISGCNDTGSGGGELNLQPIEYEKTQAEQAIVPGSVTLNVPQTMVKTGEELKITSQMAPSVTRLTTYIVADWGDGTWSHQGPGYNSTTGNTTFELSHKYRDAGIYKIKTAVIDLTSGELHGWSREKSVKVTGDKYLPEMITDVTPFSSQTQSAEYDAYNIADSKNDTAFRGELVTASDTLEYVGYMLDDYYTLDSIEVKFPAGEKFFPSNISIEYTIDGGEHWQQLQKYYYQYKFVEDIYNPYMNYPNPDGATLVFNADGIMANGVRFVSKMFPIQQMQEPKQLVVSEMRVYGTKDKLFYSSEGGVFDAALNNMFTIYGTAKTEPRIMTTIYGENPNKGYFNSGITMIASTTWLDWNNSQLSWTDYEEARLAFYNQLKGTTYGPDGWQTEVEGYIYPTSQILGWSAAPQHLNHCNIYTNNGIFIVAARDFLFQFNDLTQFGEAPGTSFFDIMTPGQSDIPPQQMWDRLQKAMNYQLEALDGKSGLITILDPRNDGTPNGVGSSYWDACLCLGYKSAYENIYFYKSLGAMADIYQYRGDTAKEKEFRDLQAKCKEEYNKLFWDESKGRYISSVNINGERMDFGYTFLNFEAVEAGLASPEQAKLIADWVDGNRIIEGDTSQGEDIYGAFGYGARTNTIDVSTIGPPYYYWDHDGALDPGPGGAAHYGGNAQNGGSIFYPVYYDLMGRLKMLGPDAARTKFQDIIDEFMIDEIRRFDYGSGGPQGVIGEFPESGMVPLIFLDGFVGIDRDYRGLKIEPRLPSTMTYAGVSYYNFNNKIYNITVSNDCQAPKIEEDGDVYRVEVPADGTYIIQLDNKVVKL